MQHTAHRENVADRPELDDATIEFATQVFDLARSGDTSTLEQLLEHGLAPNLRNAKGDSLLMLASYHGHLDTVRVLLQYKADPDLLHVEMTTIDHALTRPWSVTKNFHRLPKVIWSDNHCSERNEHVFIGPQDYLISADGYLMPVRKGQPPPDLRYFGEVQK